MTPFSKVNEKSERRMLRAQSVRSHALPSNQLMSICMFIGSAIGGGGLLPCSTMRRRVALSQECILLITDDGDFSGGHPQQRQHLHDSILSVATAGEEINGHQETAQEERLLVVCAEKVSL